ncbi:MAG: efflux RND transporter periplasmic adaptor subunit [Acidobacteria bacterium]|nr:efflux RND transporter periplasmic adaptor subunit [Acidobacteriota bacterium]
METKEQGRKRLAGILWAALGFLVAGMIFLDPLDLLSLDERLRGEGLAEAHRHDESGEEEGGLWTCGMHPQVIQEEPGQCPICHMDLVPLVAAPDETAGFHEGADHASDHGSGPMEREILFYRNPMDPTITSPVPAQDSMGMDYVPVYANEAETGGGATVRIDPAVEQNMNVRTEKVARRDLNYRIRTVGYLEFDQQRMVNVTPKNEGWVEKVYVNYEGESVRKGQPLFELYSPVLVQTQQELLSALEFAKRMAEAPEGARSRAEALVDAARQRLAYWDVSAEQLAELEATAQVFRTLTVSAPSSGVVMKRMPGLEGMAVKPGMELFHLADLSSLWLSVEAYENQVAWIREGTKAEVTLTYFPGEAFEGRVSYLAPEFSEGTRTLPVRLAVPNPDGRLRPGMFATVVFEPAAAESSLAIPTQAVLRTGERNVALVRTGAGRFQPREVVLGQEGEGYVEILAGLAEGEDVVTSAQFLLDSESNLRAAIQKMVAQRRAGG